VLRSYAPPGGREKKKRQGLETADCRLFFFFSIFPPRRHEQKAARGRAAPRGSIDKAGKSGSSGSWKAAADREQEKHSCVGGDLARRGRHSGD